MSRTELFYTSIVEFRNHEKRRTTRIYIYIYILCIDPLGITYKTIDNEKH